MKYTWTVSSVWSWLLMTLSTNTRPDLQASNQCDLGYGQSYKSSASDQWIWIHKNVNGTKTWGLWSDNRSIQWTTWTYIAEVVLDLPNSKCKWICTSPSWMAHTSEATISSAWMECIIWMEYFIVWWFDYNSWITTYIKSWEIAVI